MREWEERGWSESLQRVGGVRVGIEREWGVRGRRDG